MKFSVLAWFVLLPLLPLLGVATIWIAHRRGARWSTMVAPRLRSTLIRSANPLPRWIGQWFLLAACAAMIAAMARPQGVSGTRTEKTMGRNLLFALDLSRSMRVPDVTPDRLSQAKMIIHEIVEASPNERIGLIGFAGQAYPFAPLTVDHAAVLETLDQIDENWAPVGGSNLAAAVKLATETLRKTGQKQNALVILSDGEENDGRLNDMISSAEAAGVFVVAIAVGTTDGGYVPAPNDAHGRLLDSKGRQVLSRMKPDTLRKLAEQTGGRFTQAGSGANLTNITRSVVTGMEQFELEGRQTVVTTEFYQWLLFPSLIFLVVSLLLNTRWRAITATLCLGSLAISAPASHARQMNGISPFPTDFEGLPPWTARSLLPLWGHAACCCPISAIPNDSFSANTPPLAPPPDRRLSRLSKESPLWRQMNGISPFPTDFEGLPPWTARSLLPLWGHAACCCPISATPNDSFSANTPPLAPPPNRSLSRLSKESPLGRQMNGISPFPTDFEGLPPWTARSLLPLWGHAACCCPISAIPNDSFSANTPPLAPPPDRRLSRLSKQSPADLAKLADQAVLPSQKFQLRYAEGAAAYQSGDWFSARKAFSQALLAQDPETRRAAHLAMANALFETGWKSLGGNPLAESEAALSDDFAIFDALVRKRLKDALDADDENDDSLAPLHNISSDWADAIRHLDSALAIDPKAADALENRTTAVRSLKRFLEILEDEHQKLSESLPPPQSEPPPSPEKDPDSQEKDKNPPGDDSKNPPPCDKPGDNPNNPPKNPDDSKDPEKRNLGEKPKPKEPKPSPEKPGESPKERAKRLLKENADLEKGPVSPGRIEFRDPEKDW